MCRVMWLENLSLLLMMLKERKALDASHRELTSTCES